MQILQLPYNFQLGKVHKNQVIKFFTIFHYLGARLFAVNISASTKRHIEICETAVLNDRDENIPGHQMSLEFISPDFMIKSLAPWPLLLW